MTAFYLYLCYSGQSFLIPLKFAWHMFQVQLMHACKETLSNLGSEALDLLSSNSTRNITQK